MGQEDITNRCSDEDESNIRSIEENALLELGNIEEQKSEKASSSCVHKPNENEIENDFFKQVKYLPATVENVVPGKNTPTPAPAPDSPSTYDVENAYTQRRSSTFIKLFQAIQKKCRKVPITFTLGDDVDFNVSALAVATLCFLILCLLILQKEGNGFNELPNPTEENTVFGQTSMMSRALRHDTFKPTYPEKEKDFWKYLSTMITTISKIEFQVGKAQQGDGVVLKPLNTNSYQILGRPKFCAEKIEVESFEKQEFPEATHVHLSEMDNCYNYINNILNTWRFPKVRHLKLHRMVIRKQEFLGITNFIDKHNETINRVEIDECYLCPSPDCDAGLMNFPDHDFQLIITRRRGNPHLSPSIAIRIALYSNCSLFLVNGGRRVNRVTELPISFCDPHIIKILWYSTKDSFHCYCKKAGYKQVKCTFDF